MSKNQKTLFRVKNCLEMRRKSTFDFYGAVINTQRKFYKHLTTTELVLFYRKTKP